MQPSVRGLVVPLMATKITVVTRAEAEVGVHVHQVNYRLRGNETRDFRGSADNGQQEMTARESPC